MDFSRRRRTSGGGKEGRGGENKKEGENSGWKKQPEPNLGRGLRMERGDPTIQR